MWKRIRDDLTTFILIALFILTIAYSVVLMVFSTKGYMVSDALTYSWFGLVTGECGIAGLMKCNKRKHENTVMPEGIDTDEEENRDVY